MAARTGLRYLLRFDADRPATAYPAYPAELVTIGNHIRKRRLDLGKREVAAKVGVDASSVSAAAAILIGIHSLCITILRSLASVAAMVLSRRAIQASRVELSSARCSRSREHRTRIP